MSSLFSWLATWLGLRSAGHKVLEDTLKSDLAVAGAVMKAHALHDTEQYCRELEAQGHDELAAEVRKQLVLAALSPPTPLPVCGGPSAKPDHLPELPGPAQEQLPAPQPGKRTEKRKRGRPRKNPVPHDDKAANLPDTPF